MLINLNNILLEEEQLDLLNTIVEAARNTPRENRRKFVVIQTTGGDLLIHPSLGEKKVVYYGDIEILANNGLLSLTINSSSSSKFDVTPIGFKYYEFQKNIINNAINRIEDSVRKYINTIDFKKKYPIAYKKWCEAETLLWSSESNKQFTLIGHICREAIQEFIQHLIEIYKIENIEQDKSKTISRFRTFLDYKSDKFGNTVKEFLEAILNYWGTLSDLIQRQEHGGQKEGAPLNWEDGRRIVFQTIILMYEIDRSII